MTTFRTWRGDLTRSVHGGKADFATVISDFDLGCVKTRMFEVGKRSKVPRKPILCSDRFHQSANAQNAHYPFHAATAQDCVAGPKTFAELPEASR